jgi:hypothetical protein
MKKGLFSLLLVAVMVSVSSAQVFIGARQAGMGGTGVASAVGLNAVAYNPAGLMQGPNSEFLLSVGTASQGLDKIISTASGDPTKAMQDNFNSTFSANGSISGLLGLSVNKVGVSLLVPSIYAMIDKPTAGTYTGSSATALGYYALVLTLGRTFSVPGLPIGSLDAGVNLKAVTGAYGDFTPAAATATSNYAQGSGVGADAGVRASLNIPAISSFSVGLALRNIAQSITYNPGLRTYTVNPLTGELTLASDVPQGSRSDTMPTSTVIGCAGNISPIGLGFAADIESISGGSGYFQASSTTVTHLGLEYSLLMNALILRAGLATSDKINMTTLGAKINIPFLTLEIANVIDNKNSSNTSYVIDAGVAF